jgi:putative ABC transport system permease protein
VVGILKPFPLAADLDRSALMGMNAAATYLDADLNPSTVYVLADPAYVDDVRKVLGATANPEHPEEAQVSRPSDALQAQLAADSAFTSLFLGLGAVALLVGGVGIANVMVIGVMERRGEIGLRRALGATRRHIRGQFLLEALALAGLGGLVGVGLGSLVTVIYALSQGWKVVLPLVAILGGIASALAIGAVAGLYPAVRASQLSPTEALRS